MKTNQDAPPCADQLTTGITRQQLERFVKMRNESDFCNNLQFMMDADACGFALIDIGIPKSERWGVTFMTPHGKLIEVNGILYLEGTSDYNAIKESIDKYY